APPAVVIGVPSGVVAAGPPPPQATSKRAERNPTIRLLCMSFLGRTEFVLGPITAPLLPQECCCPRSQRRGSHPVQPPESRRPAGPARAGRSWAHRAARPPSGTALHRARSARAHTAPRRS